MKGNEVVDGLVDLWSRLADTGNLLSCAQCSHTRRKSPMPKQPCLPASGSSFDLRHDYDKISKLSPRPFDPRPASPPRPRSASPQRNCSTSRVPRVNAYDTARHASGDNLLRCTTTFPSFVPAETGAMTPYGPAPPQDVLESSSPCRVSTGAARRNAYQEAMLSTPYGQAPASLQRDAVSSDVGSRSPRPHSDDFKAGQPNTAGRQRTMDRDELRSLLDRHVDYYLQQNPRTLDRRKITRKSPGCYEIDSRTVTVEWQHDVTNKGPGHLMIRDGPLLQPFSDYMEQKDTNASYSSTGLKWSSLEMLPRQTRMTFEDPGDSYSRLDAMKVAKEQANVREQAAQYACSGQAVPMNLWQQYAKTMDRKLGQQWGSNARSRVAEHMRPVTEPAPQRPTPEAKHALMPVSLEVSRQSKVLMHGRACSLDGRARSLEPPGLFGAQPDLLKMAGLKRPEVMGGA